MDTNFSVTAVFVMDGRPIHDQSRRALKACMTAALGLAATGIHLTVRAAAHYSNLRFLFYFFRLSARFLGNEVCTINVGADEWFEAESLGPVVEIPRTPTELRLCWTTAVATVCEPISREDVEGAEIDEGMQALRLD